MALFIDPDDFDSDDALLDHIIDNVVVPSLTEQVGEEDLENIQGVAYVFGGRSDVDPSVLRHLQHMVEREGVTLEYALREFTSLHVGKKRHGVRGGLHVHYIELVGAGDDIEPLAVEDLQAMFEAGAD